MLVREFAKVHTYLTLRLLGEEGLCNSDSFDHLQKKKKEEERELGNWGLHLRWQMLVSPNLNNPCWLLQLKRAMAEQITVHSR